MTIAKAGGGFESGGVQQEFGLRNAERPREWLHKAWTLCVCRPSDTDRTDVRALQRQRQRGELGEAAERSGGADGAWRQAWEGTATDDERGRFRELHAAQSHVVLGFDPDALYETVQAHGEPPVPARIHASVVCADCGEATMETRIRRLGGRELCPPCFEAALSRP